MATVAMMRGEVYLSLLMKPDFAAIEAKRRLIIVDGIFAMRTDAFCHIPSNMLYDPSFSLNFFKKCRISLSADLTT